MSIANKARGAVALCMGLAIGFGVGCFMTQPHECERITVHTDTVYRVDTVKTVLRGANVAQVARVAPPRDTVFFYRDRRRDSVAEVEICDSVTSRGGLRWREVRVGCFLRQREVRTVETLPICRYSALRPYSLPTYVGDRVGIPSRLSAIRPYIGGYFSGAESWGAVAGVRYGRWSVGVIADAPRRSLGGMVTVAW